MKVYGVQLNSRLMLGTSQYPSPAVLADAVRRSACDVVTVSLRREAGAGRAGRDFWNLIKGLGVRPLPGTAGCHTAAEAVTTAMMARELFGTNWIKLEVIRDGDTLQPEVFGLVQAARELTAEGFQVFPRTTEDLGVADRLLDAGCRVLMPWGSPIESGRGPGNVHALRSLRERFRDVPMVIDAGLGLPSHAAHAMELGFDAILLNTAVARAGDPAAMAKAFAAAIEAGRMAYLAGPMGMREMAAASIPVVAGPDPCVRRR